VTDSTSHPANEIDSRSNYRFAPRRNVGAKMHSSTCFFLDRVRPTGYFFFALCIFRIFSLTELSL